MKFFDLKSALEKRESVRSLVLFGRGITHWPDELLEFPRLEYLDLSSNHLMSFPDWLPSLGSLRQLLLSSNDIQEFPAPDALPPKLESLNLRNNRITSVRVEGETCSTLNSLDVSGNDLKDVPHGLASFPELKRLMLDAVGLRNLPPDWKKLRQLKVLSLRENQISRLPGWMSNLPGVLELDLASNRIKKWPEVLSHWQELKRLDLSDNKLEALPDPLPNWPRLQRLFLARNKLSSLPNGWNQLKQLSVLDLSGNRLSDLTSDWTSLPRLQDCRLQKNRKLELPPTIADLQSLRKLDVRAVGINTLPEAIWQLNQLRVLQGIRGSKKILWFLEKCRQRKIPPKWRSLLFKSYNKVPEGDWDPQLFSSGMDLNLPRLRRHLWQWHQEAFNTPKLKPGSSIWTSDWRSGLEGAIETSTLRRVDDPEQASHIIYNKPDDPMPEKWIPLTDLQEFFKTEVPASGVPQDLLDNFLPCSSDANLLLLASLLKGKQPTGQQLEHLLESWLVSQPGAGRSAMASYLRSCGVQIRRSPEELFLQPELLETLLSGSPLDAGRMLRKMEQLKGI